MYLRQRRSGIGTDALWAVVVLAGFAFVISLIPVPPNDIWWHLKVGEMIVETRTVPSTSIFAWTLPSDTPYFYGVWLGEVLLYVLYRWGGLELLIALRTAIMVGAFWLMASEARRRSGSWHIAALVLAFGCSMSLSNTILRPQMWSFLPAMAYLMLLDRFVAGDLSGKWLWVCPLVMMLWVNLHGAFVLGFGLLGAYAGGEALRALFGAERQGARRNVVWLGAVSLLTALAALLNPRGPEIARYVLHLLTDQTTQELLLDWQSPTPTGVANISFYLSVLFLLLVSLYSRYRPTPAEALLTAGCLWLAWGGQRYIIWFALFVMPILAKIVRGLWAVFPTIITHRSRLNGVVAVLLFVPAMLVLPWWVESIPLPENFRERVLWDTEAGPLLDVSTPVGAARYLVEHPGGRLFNGLGHGSYLIWAMPDQGVFIDPRIELYPAGFVKDYIHIVRGVRYNELLSTYGADRILLDLGADKELYELLRQDPLWVLEYEDPYSQVWMRAAGSGPGRVVH